MDIHREVQAEAYPFVLAFDRNTADIAEAAVSLSGKLGEDAKLWIAYPEKSSKNHKTELHVHFTLKC